LPLFEQSGTNNVFLSFFLSFFLHTFSIAEKVCNPAGQDRQKGASTLKANAGPLPMHRDCQATLAIIQANIYKLLKSRDNL
jgi:hypothetical protein